MTIQQLNKELGNIDLYLLDQILKGNIDTNAKILDAGCGEGRNLIYFLNNHYEVHGIDQNPDAIRMLQFILGANYPQINKGNFHIGTIDQIPYPNETFDWIISSAVLHFAQNQEDFWAGIKEMTRVLKTNGVLFVRMTSDIGLDEMPETENGKYNLPDGSYRFLITEELISQLLTDFAFTPIEPIKSVVVDKMRSMTTLVLRKNQIQA
ncbi:class I SAM-dependent methyltransferase [Reichenbachiella agarivorans]|uniref:Class I SAM-dependent methyltransferase n=1 Tax=Reichenbachiella agarivorans TaxID=2979464 RepID=A0ABY6CKA5_9BACT|nr:class I SAM-dependent methyltransferase [Reichenbachiella agarivorans]UXP30950.1 class I SAM-dependent methyltransferase [Reichenbachiella agarivorans]